MKFVKQENGKNNKVVLYLMRHGQTIMNKAERVQGWCDGILTNEGLEVANFVALGLSDIKFEAVYTSDLGRAIKTARIVLNHNKSSENLSIVEMPGLREMYFGKYEGEFEKRMFGDIFSHLDVKSFEEARKLPDFGRLFMNACATLDETGTAENYDTMINRIMKAISAIIEEISANGGGNVLVVVHGGILRNLLSEIDKNINIQGMDNSSVSIVEFENDEFNIISINDMRYKEKGERLVKGSSDAS